MPPPPDLFAAALHKARLELPPEASSLDVLHTVMRYSLDVETCVRAYALLRSTMDTDERPEWGVNSERMINWLLAGLPSVPPGTEPLLTITIGPGP